MTGTERRERFDRLFEEHFRALLAYALRRVEEPADAADVAAETLLVAWRRLDQVPAGDEARPWLFGVARRVLSNQRRGERRRDALADRLREALAALPAPAPPDEDADLVREAMRRLRPGDREVLALVCWEGLDPAQAAAALGIPAATARTRLHRARARMKQELTALGWRWSTAHSPSVLPLEEGS
jgi:RNA polymerase sigma-70 factor (ECF subfamily)